MRLALFTFLLSLFSVVSAHAAEIYDVNVFSGEHEYAEVHFSGVGFQQDSVTLFQMKGEKPRIVVDFEHSSSPLLASGNFTSRPEEALMAIRGAARDQTSIRFVLDLQPGEVYHDHQIQPDKVKVIVKKASSHQQRAVVVATSSSTVRSDANIPTPRIKPKIARKPVIVIDAGHGGKDPGALGGLGLREKKVTLAAALELKRQLLKTGRYEVVLTRADDRYIEHEDRLRLARAKSADLFISLHADATVGKSARGASVYTLADRARNRSKKIVDSQNWIMDVNLSEQSDRVGDILVDLAQRDTFSQSTKFADILISELGQSTKLLRNTHRRAGYYVLLAPDVPAVLLELGFISNPDDEKLLKSERHRRKLMSSVVSAINLYFQG